MCVMGSRPTPTRANSPPKHIQGRIQDFIRGGGEGYIISFAVDGYVQCLTTRRATYKKSMRPEIPGMKFVRANDTSAYMFILNHNCN